MLLASLWLFGAFIAIMLLDALHRSGALLPTLSVIAAAFVFFALVTGGV